MHGQQKYIKNDVFISIKLFKSGKTQFLPYRNIELKLGSFDAL